MYLFPIIIVMASKKNSSSATRIDWFFSTKMEERAMPDFVAAAPKL
jgi:hypothetical protein